VTEEGEATRGIGADAVETVLGDSGDVVKRGGAEVGKFLRRQVAPDVLNGIEVRCLAWQSLD
jgi:hypothetical protein